MNSHPDRFDSVLHERLHDFVVRAATHVGMLVDKAGLLAGLLTSNDLRGVFSHGAE